MSTKTISVTEAARNFADCINRARYQGTTFVLHKNGVPVARIVPEERKPRTGREIARALRVALKDVHLGEEEATAWLQDLENARKTVFKGFKSSNRSSANVKRRKRRPPRPVQ